MYSVNVRFGVEYMRGEGFVSRFSSWLSKSLNPGRIDLHLKFQKQRELPCTSRDSLDKSLHHFSRIAGFILGKTCRKHQETVLLPATSGAFLGEFGATFRAGP
jgi:hypothetical protein